VFLAFSLCLSLFLSLIVSSFLFVQGGYSPSLTSSTAPILDRYAVGVAVSQPHCCTTWGRDNKRRKEKEERRGKERLREFDKIGLDAVDCVDRSIR
jgi:hypothetical protein